MRYTNLKAFQKHLVSAAPSNFSRVYLVAVAADFEREKVIHSILSSVQSPDAPATRLSGAEFVLRDFCDALQSPSLFGGESVWVLDELDQLNKKTLEAVGELIKQPLPGYLILGSRTKALSAAVEKMGVVLDLVDEKSWDRETRLTEGLVERAKNAGKRLESDVIPLLFERVEKESALLENELDKLICYVGDRSSIGPSDVLAVGASSRTQTLWQVAEEMVWEGSPLPSLDETTFHGLIPILRSQLQMGLKIASLIEGQVPSDAWSAHLPKIWPKTLEKRTSQAARLGSSYFRKGIQALFEIELLSRGASTQYAALLSLFRSQMSVHVKTTAPSQSPR